MYIPMDSRDQSLAGRGKLLFIVLVVVIIGGVVGVSLSWSTNHNFVAQQVPLNSPSYAQSLDGQVMMQVAGSPGVEIPIMKEMGVTTAMIVTGAADPAYSNATRVIESILPYRQAGLQVAYEYEMQGFWGRLVDMNFPAFEYAQNHPAQAMASFMSTVINTSSPPSGAQILPNGSMIIPLEVNAQYYVYEFYSPAQFTWFYNETHYFLGTEDRSLCFGSAFCYANPFESNSTYLLRYGSEYTLFYNTTGLYLSFYSHRNPKIIYNLHWISFDLSSTTGYWDGKYYGSGLVSWPSLFFSGGFNSYMTAWIKFCQQYQGYVNVIWEDSGGFPSLDANPAIIQYLDAKYHFNFTFNNWAWTPNTPNGNITQSEFLWHYENYLLISSFAKEKATIAHEYGMMWIFDTSDQKAGDSFEYSYLDGLGVWAGNPSLREYVATFGALYTWAGYAWYSNSSLALGVVDWEGGPGESVSTLNTYFHTAELLGSMDRPQATYIAFEWQFPLSDVSQQIIQAFRNDVVVYESALSYGRFVSSSGGVKYSVGTLYLTGPTHNIQNVFPSTFYEHNVVQLPLQFNTYFIGVGWTKYLGSPIGLNPQGNEVSPYTCNLVNYFEPPWGTLGATGYANTPAGCYLNLSGSVMPYVGGLLNRSNAFYVNDVYFTYVYQRGSLYYVLLSNWLNTTRSVVFSYHNLENYYAINLNNGSITPNNTQLVLPPLGQLMLVLEPESFMSSSLLYTNATFYASNDGGIFISNNFASNTVLVLQSNISLSSFLVNEGNGATETITPYASSIIDLANTGHRYIYSLLLKGVSTATVYGLTSQDTSALTSSTVQGSSSTSMNASTITQPSTSSSSPSTSNASTPTTTTGTSTSYTTSSTTQNTTSSTQSETVTSSTTDTTSQTSNTTTTPISITSTSSLSTSTTQSAGFTSPSTFQSSSTSLSQNGQSSSFNYSNASQPQPTNLNEFSSVVSTSSLHASTQLGLNKALGSSTVSGSVLFKSPGLVVGLSLMFIIVTIGIYAVRSKSRM